MDEAERCHRLTYISQGKLLLTGTIEDVIAQAGLTVYVIEGEDLSAIAENLETLDGVDQVASFGATLHVVGRDPVRLKRAVDAAVLGHKVRVSPGATTLEDVLIELMSAKG
jgi:ABC-2 type transport system ATP-binding protein